MVTGSLFLLAFDYAQLFPASSTSKELSHSSSVVSTSEFKMSVTNGISRFVYSFLKKYRLGVHLAGPCWWVFWWATSKAVEGDGAARGSYLVTASGSLQRPASLMRCRLSCPTECHQRMGESGDDCERQGDLRGFSDSSFVLIDDGSVVEALAPSLCTKYIGLLGHIMV